MTELGSLVASLAGSGARVQLYLGTCASIDWASQMCAVQIGATPPIPARMAGEVPRVGERVYMLLIDDLAITVGRPSRPALAVVNKAPVNSTVEVKSEDGSLYIVRYPTGYVPAIGHNVLMDWRAGGHILTRIDAADVPAPPQPGGGGAQSRSKTFNAIDSGSYRSAGWQSGSVYFGSSFPTAGYFYGTQIADTIPDTATINTDGGTGIRIYLEVISASGASTMTLSLHTSATRPGGGLSLDQTINIGAMPNGFRGDVALPTAWANLLKTGARLGVGTSGAGLRILKGQNAQPAAGAITIDWKE